MTGLLGRKQGMTSIISDSGLIVPTTIVQVLENEVVQVKTTEKDKTNSIVLGYNAYKHPSKNKKFKVHKEFKTETSTQHTKGQKINVDALQGVKEVMISSVSKGKGFQGVIKRHGFHGGPASHGSHFHREPGSIGQRTRPGKVQKGKKLPGHMGVDRVTLKKRPVLKIDSKNSLVYIKGAIPGAKNTLIEIRF